MTVYFPAWKDARGNRMIIPADNLVFETEDAALRAHGRLVPRMVVVGFEPDGVATAERQEDGTYDIPHMQASLPPFGDVVLIDGPAFYGHVDQTVEN